MITLPIHRWIAGAALLLLSACLFTPGKFISTLDVRQDGTFVYAYTGEIHMLALSRLAQMGREGGTFKPQTCFGENGGTERECTAAEIEEQKREWTESQTRAADRRKRESEQMKGVLGGIDFSDPKAAEELASRLRKQAGWKRVVYKGDGLFEVDFALSGRLDHDFVFPTVERFPQANAFVTLTRRQDGTLRIDAPGFGPAGGMDQFQGMMRGAAAAASSEDGKSPAPGLPMADGRFTIITDAAVLANNTDEGPQQTIAGSKLEWTVTARSDAAPMALLRIGAGR